MITFLPLPDFAETASVLDTKRLGKQRVEAVMILETLAGLDDRFAHAPVVGMWRKCEFLLAQYALTMCREWERRNNTDNMETRIIDVMHGAMVKDLWTPERNNGRPWWLGVNGFHLSHRSNLVRKDPKHYRQFWPDVPDHFPYVWPAEKEPLPR